MKIFHNIKRINLHKLCLTAVLVVLSFTMVEGASLQELESFIAHVKKNSQAKNDVSELNAPLHQITKLSVPAQLTIPDKNPFKNNTATNSNSLAIQQGAPILNKPTESTLISIHYVSAEDLSKIIANKSLGILSSSGSVMATDNHHLYICDETAAIHRARLLIQNLDVASSQILINAKIVTVDNQFMHKLGVLYKTGQLAKSDSNSSVSNAVESTLDNISIPILKFRDSSYLAAELVALEDEGHAELISNPELLTLNQQAAVIESGEEVPYQEATSSGATSVAFKKAVLRLKVTPELMPNHQILLHLIINQDKISSLTVNGVPAIRTQALQTQVLMDNHETLVLGGIFEQTDSDQERGVPGLRKIPVVGVLFRQHRREFSHRQLLVFVTPSVVVAHR